MSTKDGDRWTFPKGHRKPGETLGRAAAREALEEAGLVGLLDDRCLTVYRYPGRRGRDDTIAAFVLHVTGAGYPAEAFREQAWCDPASARRRLAEGRDPFHADELGRVLDAAVRAAEASREQTLRGGPGWLARRVARRRPAKAKR